MAILSGYERQTITVADANGDHKRISRWTNASTVEFDDTEALDKKITAINERIDTNLADINDQTPTYTVASSNTALTSGEKISVAFGKIAKAISSLISHLADTTKHITSAERTTWNSKQDSSTAINTSNIADQSVSHAETADTLTGVTATASELNVLDGITATTTELNYMDGVTSNVQTQFNELNTNLDNKQDNITGGATTITGSNLTASRALVSDGNGKVAVSAVTSTELGYLDGVTSAIQTQLNGKASSSHGHSGLTWQGDWKQNMDVVPGNYSAGAYWVTSVTTDSRYVEGTHAFTSTFYYLFVFESSSSVQFAIQYGTGKIKSRCYVNSKWQSWTGATAIADGGTGATTATDALSNIAATAGNITSPTYLLSLGSGGYAAGGGYTTLTQLKTAMALDNVNNTADSAKTVNFSQSTGRLYSSTIDAFVSLNSYNNLKPYVYSTGADNDNTITLGSTTARWKQLHAGTSTISTSDRNLKDNIKPLTDIHKQFFMKLIPVSFTFKDGESGRTHVGFISQDVEQVMTELGMTDLDFAGFCKDVKTVVEYSYEDVLDENGNVVLDEDGKPEQKLIERDIPLLDEEGNLQYIYSLRYSEFIGIIAYVLQDTVNRLDSIEERLEKLEG